MSHLFTRSFKPSKPIVIRTVLPATPQPPKVVAVAPAPAPKPAPPKATPKPQKPKPTPVAAPKKPDKAITEIAETLKHLSEPAPVAKTALVIPSKIQSKAEVVAKIEDLSYGEFLIAYLQSSLELPEIGEVRAELKINSRGMLIDCIILDTKSEKNSEFLLKKLPQLTYPVKKDFIGGSFTVTFRNID
jgi:type IV secretory pathway VirB10-like protein